VKSLRADGGGSGASGCGQIAEARSTKRRNLKTSGELTEDGLTTSRSDVQKLTDKFRKTNRDHLEAKSWR